MSGTRHHTEKVIEPFFVCLSSNLEAICRLPCGTSRAATIDNLESLVLDVLYSVLRQCVSGMSFPFVLRSGRFYIFFKECTWKTTLKRRQGKALQ